jgi:hypothetical protein
VLQPTDKALRQAVVEALEQVLDVEMADQRLRQ